MTCAYFRWRLLGSIPLPSRPVAPKRPVRFYKTMQSLAAITASVTVPAHGLLISGFTKRNVSTPYRTQVWSFLKQLLRGCAWAAMIAAGMLVYTAFVQKWKENGFPAIPISALVAIDQGLQPRTPNTSNVIPLGGGGNAQRTGTAGPVTTRQTSLLDLEDFEG